MFLAKKSPYNPGYALPRRVLGEKYHRAVATFTEQNGDVAFNPIYPKSHPWYPGYAELDDEVYQEEPQNARVTASSPDHYVDYMPNDASWIDPGGDYAGMGDAIEIPAPPAGSGQLFGIDTNKLLLFGAAAAVAYYLWKKR